MTAQTKMPYYDASKVREAVKGHWLEVFSYLADSEIGEVISRPKKHITCPVHGTSNKNGKGDGFSLFKDVVDTGAGGCTTCGHHHDGFALLMWLKGWTFRETLNKVAEVLRIEPEPDRFEKTNSEKSSNKNQSVSTTPVQNVDEPTVAEPKTDVVIPIFQPSGERLKEIRDIQHRLAQQTARESASATERIESVWRDSITLDGGLPQPLLRYLKHRFILLRMNILRNGDSLRFHHSLPYYQEDDEGNNVLVGKFPAIIAAIKDLEGNIITLHRTYLTPTGYKAKVESARKMMTVPADKTVTGNAIQLGGQPVDGVLGVAEGLETALSVIKCYGIPTWSAVSATILANFEPPEGVHTLIIWADRDRSLTGQKVAQALKTKMEEKGINTYIMIPMRPIMGKSVDWNNVLMKEGIMGLPPIRVINNIIKKGIYKSKALAAVIPLKRVHEALRCTS